MNALKLVFFISTFLLSACTAHKSPISIIDKKPESPGSKSPQPSQSESPLNKTTASAAEAAQQPITAKNITAWDLSGVMAARNQSKSWTAQVHWVQQGSASYQIRLSGPLGSGTVLIERSGATVSFRDGAKAVQSQNADELLQQQTGVRLPVHNLYYWLRGIPAPGSVSAEKRDKSNLLQSFRQAGFTIEFPEYTHTTKATLPKTIRLQGNGVFVKMVIKRWSIH